VEKLSHPSNRVPDTCRIYTKVPWSCSGGLWWLNALLRRLLCWCFLYFGSYLDVWLYRVY
jgi:hypothetical protein